ncbi:MAG TPA: type II toxin-antitoxin system Phd/YefM family antitoxin [Clostridiaceae bacterium]|jgi:prevent-host-death family protein|nr:type II toxin-antitoxin system Phd/YefM family antitoxin [Clostridiaceae bacterium]
MLTTATEMRNNFSHYLTQVTDENKEVIITKNNVRVARLVPYVSDIEKYFTVRENAVNYDYHRKTVSYEEFMEIYENTSTRMEFINGEIFIMDSPTFFHQAILGDLYVLFREYFKEEKCRPVIAPFDVHFKKQDIKDPDVMQPDLIVLCDLENNINEKGRYMGTPTLTLEILSPSTRSIDMLYKLNTFMTSGVSEYWLADPDNQMITIYTFTDYEIDKMKVYKNEETAKSEIFEGLSVDVKSLFKDMF